MLEPTSTYSSLCEKFHWPLPKQYNIGVDAVDRHAGDAQRIALIYEDAAGQAQEYSFADIKQLSDRLAIALSGLGVEQGDRIGILLPQSPQTAISHIATYKLGAIALPLFTLFGPDALQYRLQDSGARVVITDCDNVAKVMDLKSTLPDLQTVIVTDNPAPAGVLRFDDLLEDAHGSSTPAPTGLNDPALIIYTSGTTGNPKGALHAHRTLLGHLPGVELPHEFFPQPNDLFWTPADWAWIGGLLDVLLPAWHHGQPVLAHRARKFDPEYAFHLLEKYAVRNVFFPPTALKLMRQVESPRSRYQYNLRSIGSGGETLGGEMLSWGKDIFGLTINEFYGQTECNLVVGNCAGLMEVRPGSMGRAIPGHEVAIINDNGEELPDGEHGQIAVRRPDPVMFLEYWNNPEATKNKFIGDWLQMGDLGKRDSDGYFWFLGRTDDVITSGGYRIGPAEVEDSLLKHPAVAIAAVIGVPDAIRTEIVKAFIVLRPGVAPSDALSKEIQHHVKHQLAAHEYPREIEFVSELPMTTTGKIIRRELRQRELDRQSEQHS